MRRRRKSLRKALRERDGDDGEQEEEKENERRDRLLYSSHAGWLPYIEI